MEDAIADLEEAEEDGTDEEIASAEIAVELAEAAASMASNLSVTFENTSIGMDDDFALTITDLATMTPFLSTASTVEDDVIATFPGVGEYEVVLDGTFTQMDGTIIDDSSTLTVTITNDFIVVIE